MLARSAEKILALLLACFALPNIALAAKAPDLIFWHTQDRDQAQILAKIIAEFGAAHALTIQVETGVEIGEALLAQTDPSKLPDVVLAPSDITGLAKPLRLSEVPPALLKGISNDGLIATVRVGKTAYGLPLLQGNHLMLFFNKKLVTKPATTWDELVKESATLKTRGIKPVAMDYENAFTFMTFLASFGSWPLAQGKVTLDTPACRDALSFYKSLGDQGLVPKTCGYDCPTTGFYHGEFAYAVSGEWALHDARVALGKDLGVSLLPAIGKRSMVTLSGTHALVFPAGSLSGPKRAHLEALAAYLLSEPIQERWQREGGRIAVQTAALKHLAASGDAASAASLAQLRASRPLPNDRRIALIWPAIRKALRLYLLGVKSREEASRLMQDLATSEKPE